MDCFPPEKCYIIAEAGVNHNGDTDLALELVDAAAAAGADAVKFQTFIASELADSSAPKAVYQSKNMDSTDSQLEMLQKLELNTKAHQKIMQRCHDKGIGFLSTPFDFPSLDLLLELGIKKIKISSGDLNNGPLLLKIARSGLPAILSTGMSTLDEVREAVGVFAYGILEAERTPCRADFLDYYKSGKAKPELNQRLALLHCTTQYPTPVEDTNLKAIDTLRKEFDLCTGFSDHTSGIEISLAAVARGASIIEKHLTLDKNLSGPDHKASLEPLELSKLVKGIRNIEQAIGTGRKEIAPSERENIKVARKSLHFPDTGKLSAFDIAIKRPGDGPSPMDYWDILQERSESET